MIERREGHFVSAPTGASGSHSTTAELFYQSWTIEPASSPRATLVLTHGIGEHSEAYVKTAESLTALGFDIIAWDLRGHGRSEGKRGHIDEFRQYSLDLAQFIKYLKRNGRLDQPFALVGHSMGGLITLQYLLECELDPQLRAVALSSPLLGVALAVPPIKDAAARMMRKILPSFTMHNEIQYNDLSRDAEWVKGYGTDPLRHDKISPALYLGMFETIDLVKASASRVKLPILIQAAGDERIVSTPAIKEFFPLIGSQNKKLLVYQDSRHEIYNDFDRDQVFADLTSFLKPLIGPQSTELT